ncbi:helix-turn-helix domain-containing protein [Salinisphaera sp. LB1]|uniref:helix-turn-helix domain-containing protein n=1 Tax=Salinisphaera sp. LB1 TaxID=2183911 RepID=UPI000D707806|nr:helix-turn-helix domain-containing protein [Salinisphaera sp. LB1]AWN17174.1 transcriptional regulator, Crp/Fnr family [Salinisphaera sp. LB1]
MTEHASDPGLRVADLLHYSRNASIHELCLPHSLSPLALPQLGDEVWRERQLVRGETLFRQGHGMHALYCVTYGLLKTVIVDNEGREQITGFHFPTELVGLDALPRREHVCMASAVTASRVRVLPLHRLQEAMHQAPALRDAFVDLVGRALAQHEQLLLVVNQRRSIERLAILLLSFSCRLGRNGRAATVLRLPMSRAEIANYLGLTQETVSRAFRRLQTAGMLTVRVKNVTLTDPARLTRCATEGWSETY